MQRKLLIVLCFLAFLFSIAGYVSYTQKADSERDAYFREQEEKIATGGIVIAGPYCFPDRHPEFLLLIVAINGVTSLSFCLIKRPFIPALSALASFSVFPYWFGETKNALSQTEGFRAYGLDMIFYHAGVFDVFVLVLTSVIAFLQISIVACLVLKAFGTKKVLP